MMQTWYPDLLIAPHNIFLEQLMLSTNDTNKIITLGNPICSKQSMTHAKVKCVYVNPRKSYLKLRKRIIILAF